MNAAEYEKWVEVARERTRERMAAAQQRFGLGTHARYQIDLPTATVRFYDAADAEQVRASLQVAGSWSPAAKSWLWGWENQSVPAPAVSRMAAVRERGAQEDIGKLQAAFTPCDEGQAWSMASLAADIVDAECVYRASGPKSQLFLLLTDIRQAN